MFALMWAAGKVSQHGKSLTINMVFVFLVAAIVCFILACNVIKQWAKPFWIPLGLAFFALACLVQFCYA